MLVLLFVAIALAARCPRGSTWVPCPPNARCIQAGFCQPKPKVGGDSDSQGCKRSAGYRWSFKLQRCVRPWEEPKLQDPPFRAGMPRPPGRPPVRVGLPVRPPTDEDDDRPIRVGLPRPRPLDDDDRPIRVGLPRPRPRPQVDDDRPIRMGLPRPRPQVDDDRPIRMGLPRPRPRPQVDEDRPIRAGTPRRRRRASRETEDR